jgi:hypothetical protein
MSTDLDSPEHSLCSETIDRERNRRKESEAVANVVRANNSRLRGENAKLRYELRRIQVIAVQHGDVTIREIAKAAIEIGLPTLDEESR